MNNINAGIRAAFIAFWVVGVLSLAGCDDNDYKHDVPPGQGSLIVDNRSWDVIHVYISGYYANDVGDYDYEAYDRAPGMVRVVLDQKGGSRSYSHDIDVIEGKRTVLKVFVDELYWEYGVTVCYD